MPLPLAAQFTQYFTSHSKTEVKNLLITAEAIFEAQTTNLNKVKDKVGQITRQTKTLPESNYKRLTRFFNTSDKRKLSKSLLCVCFCLLDKSQEPKYLTLDGTSWELGEKNIHLLTLAIVYGGVSIPIWWEELDKKGTSNFKERKKVIREASKFLNLSGLILLADREYIGRSWFNYLYNKGIEFIIRLKKNIYVEEINAASEQAAKKDYFQKARYSKLEKIATFQKYRRHGVLKRIKIKGKPYSFVVFKNPKTSATEPLIYFISSLKIKQQITEAYPIRWTIECCFKHLKSNGFRLENINMKDTLKIMLMMAIVVFLYVLCICEGLKQLKTVKLSNRKKYKNGTIFLTISIFRKGLSLVCLKFNNLNSFCLYLKLILKDRNLLILQNVQ